MLTQKCGDKPYVFIDNVGIELYTEKLPIDVELYNEEIFEIVFQSNEDLSSYELVANVRIYVLSLRG